MDAELQQANAQAELNRTIDQWVLPGETTHDLHIKARAYQAFTIQLDRMYDKSAKTFGDSDKTSADSTRLHLYNLLLIFIAILETKVGTVRAKQGGYLDQHTIDYMSNKRIAGGGQARPTHRPAIDDAAMDETRLLDQMGGTVYEREPSDVIDDIIDRDTLSSQPSMIRDRSLGWNDRHGMTTDEIETDRPDGTTDTPPPAVIMRTPMAIFLEEVRAKPQGNSESAMSNRPLNPYDSLERMNDSTDPIAYTIHVMYEHDWDPNVFLSSMVSKHWRDHATSSERLYSSSAVVPAIEEGGDEAVEDNNEVMIDANGGEGGGRGGGRKTKKKGASNPFDPDARTPRNFTTGKRTRVQEYQARVRQVNPMYLITLAGCYFQDQSIIDLAFDEGQFGGYFSSTHVCNAKRLFSISSALKARDIYRVCNEQSLTRFVEILKSRDRSDMLYVDHSDVDANGFTTFRIPAKYRDRFVQVHLDKIFSGEFMRMPFPHVQRRQTQILAKMYPTIFGEKSKVPITDLLTKNGTSIAVQEVPPSVPLPPIMIGSRAFTFSTLKRMVREYNNRNRREHDSGEQMMVLAEREKMVLLEEEFLRSDNEFSLDETNIAYAEAALNQHRTIVLTRNTWREALRESIRNELGDMNETDRRLLSIDRVDDPAYVPLTSTNHARALRMHHAPIDRTETRDSSIDQVDCLDITRNGDRNAETLARLQTVMNANHNIEDKYKRAAYILYQRSCIALDKTVCDSKANIPLAARITFKYGEDRGWNANGKRPMFKVYDPTMDLASNLFCDWQFQYFATFDMASENPGYLLFLFVCSLNAMEHKFAPHLHIGMTGDTTTSKSHLERMNAELRISVGNDSTTVEISRKTENANSVNSYGANNYLVTYVEEKSQKELFGDPKFGETTGDPIEKTMMDTGRIKTHSCYMKENGDAVIKTRVNEGIGVHIWASNCTASISKMHASVFYRFIIMFMLPPKEHAQNLGKFKEQEAQRGNKDIELTHYIKEQHRCIQYIIMRIELLIAQNIMADVSTWLATFLTMRVCDYVFNKHHIQPMAPRTIDHIRRLARTICLVDAASQFLAKGGRFAGNEELNIPPAPITPENLVSLEPMLYVRVEHIVSALGMCIRHCYFPGEEVIKLSIKQLFESKRKDRRTSMLFERYGSSYGYQNGGGGGGFGGSRITNGYNGERDRRTHQRVPGGGGSGSSGGGGGDEVLEDDRLGDQSIDYNWVTFPSGDDMNSFLNELAAVIAANVSVKYTYSADVLKPLIQRMANTYITVPKYAGDPLDPNKLPHPTNETHSVSPVKIHARRVLVNYHWISSASASPEDAVKEALTEILKARYQPYMRVAWTSNTSCPSTRNVIELGNRDCEDARHAHLFINNTCYMTQAQLEKLYDEYVPNDKRWREIEHFKLDQPLSAWASAMHMQTCFYGPKVTRRDLARVLYRFQSVFNIQDPASTANDQWTEADFDSVDDTEDIDTPANQFLVADAKDTNGVRIKGFRTQTALSRRDAEHASQEQKEAVEKSFKIMGYLAHISARRYEPFSNRRNYPGNLVEKTRHILETPELYRENGVSIGEQYGISPEVRSFGYDLARNIIRVPEQRYDVEDGGASANGGSESRRTDRGQQSHLTIIDETDPYTGKSAKRHYERVDNCSIDNDGAVLLTSMFGLSRSRNHGQTMRMRSIRGLYEDIPL